MSIARPGLRSFVEPAIGILFLVGWILANSTRLLFQYVPLRSQTFLTSPYAIAIAVGFALVIALCRVSPVAASSILGGLLLLQLLFWPARFSQDSWSAYLVLILAVVASSMYGSTRFRRFAFWLAILFAEVVVALLTLPNLSMSGTFGTIDGQGWDSPDLWEFVATWAIVSAGLVVGAWFLGRAFRPRSAQASVERPADRSAIESLSSREQQIFLLAAEGKSNREIADAASIEESTVKTHLNSISTKLGLKSRMELIAFAYRNGVLSPA